MARITRRFLVGAIAAVLGFHTVVLGAFLLVLGSQRVFVFGVLTAGTGLLMVGGGLWRAIGAWGTTDGDGAAGENERDDRGDTRADGDGGDRGG